MGPGHYGVASAFSTAGCVCSPDCEVIARMGLNHPWGVVEATFEPEMLKLGRLQAHRLQVRFQDGTMIDTDNADALPSALSLDGAPGEAVIVLALPLMQANGGNCLKPEEVAERPVRFRQRWRDVRNQFGDDTRQIAVIQPELTLRFAHRGQQRLPDLSACSPAAGLAGGPAYRRDVSLAAAADPGQPLAGDAA